MRMPKVIARILDGGLIAAVVIIIGLMLVEGRRWKEETVPTLEKEPATTAGAEEVNVTQVEEPVIPPVEEKEEVVAAPLMADDPFVPLDVPLDAELQKEIMAICREKDISFAFVMSVICQESDFRPDLIGDNGDSYGLMQIQIRHFEEEMELLGIDDPLDPLQNVRLGVYLLVGMFEKYEDTAMVLMVYCRKFPVENKKVAPVQPAQRKETKVVKANKEWKSIYNPGQQVKVYENDHIGELIKKTEAPGVWEVKFPTYSANMKETKFTEYVEPEDSEENLPGQQSIEDYPEYMPEEPLKGEVVESPKNVENTKCGADWEHQGRGYKEGMKNNMDRMPEMYEKGNWKGLKELAERIVWACEMLEDLE